jgi:hypothetical protein
MRVSMRVGPNGLTVPMRRRLLVSLATLMLLVGGMCFAPSAAAAPPANATWLQVMNWYRVASGLVPAVEEPSWTTDLQAHIRYLDLTPAGLRTGQYASAHTENPASPYATAGGLIAGQSSDLGGGRSDREAIEGWIRAPFHAIAILQPGLTKVAFYRDPVTHTAGLDVLRGTNSAVQSAKPILFPGDGATVDLNRFEGGEFPNPLETCGYQAPAGLPLIAMLPTTPSAQLVAELTGPAGTLSSTSGDLCIVSQHTYRTSDLVYGSTGLGLLTGSRALFVIARSPLRGGTYVVRLMQPGQADITWSFSIPGPPPPVPAGRTARVHASSVGGMTAFGNLTVIDPAADGFTTAYPCDQGRPTASTNNFAGQQTIPNFAAVRTDSQGDICLYTSSQAHLLWDQVLTTGVISAQNARRLLDTRPTGQKVLAGSRTRLHVSDTAEMTVFGNLTVVAAEAAGFSTVFPCTDSVPEASTSNFVAGQTIPNFAAVRADSAGDICIFITAGAHLIWDQVAASGGVVGQPPRRLLDTRKTGRLHARTSVLLKVTDQPGATVLGNLTVTAPSEAGFTTAYPCDEGLPNTSNNNFVAGQTIANFAAVKTDRSGRICIYVSADADVIWDQSGATWMLHAETPTRLADSRSGNITLVP